MTTIKLNNENKTEITFSYDNGLPYKKAIRPSIEYGDWSNNKDIMIIKLFLSKQDIALFRDKNNIECLKLNKIQEEIWFDLHDVYLVLSTNLYIDNKIKNKKFILAFLDEEQNNILCSWGFSK